MEEFDVERYERSIERGLLDTFVREFDAHEDVEFLENLCVILGDYLNPHSAIYWTQELKLFSEAWQTRTERRQYIEAALDRTAGMVVARGWDPTPLFWVTKYIGECKNREASKVEEVFDLLQRLSIAITGKSSRWLRLYDEEAPWRPANDTALRPPAIPQSTKGDAISQRQSEVARRPRPNRRALTDDEKKTVVNLIREISAGTSVTDAIIQVEARATEAPPRGIGKTVSASTLKRAWDEANSGS